MTLPRAKSRAIVVDGVHYRWLVTPADEQFRLAVLIEHADGHGQQLRLTREDVYFTAGVPAIVPRYVAAVIRHALKLGWRPEAGGREFTLAAAGVRQAQRLRSEPPAPGLTAMVVRVDFDPIRARYPWPHLNPNLFANFRLAGDTKDRAIGTLFAHLARCAELAPSLGLARILELLAAANDDDEVDSPWDLPGGVEIVLDGRLVLGHGCCVAVGDWPQWKRLLETGREPWNGHDPFSTAALVDEGVALYGGDRREPIDATITRDRYRALVAGLERDLLGFTRRLEAWLAGRCSASTTAALRARWAAAAGLELPVSDADADTG